MAADFFSRAASPADSSEPGFRVTLPQVLAFASRYKWVIAAVFLCTVASAYAALNLMTEQYEAHAALLVKLGRENLDAPPTARNGFLSTGLRREELGSEVQIIRSDDLISQVVDLIGLEAFRVTRVPPPGLIGKVKFYVKGGLRWTKDRVQDGLIALDLKKRLSERDTAIAYLLQELAVEPQKESDVISLRLRMANPALAVRIQETLIQKYLAQRVRVRQNGGVKEFFEREVQTSKATLQDAETKVHDWKVQRDLTVPGEQKTLLLGHIREISAQRESAMSRGQALTRQMATAQSLIASTAERVRTRDVETPNAAVQQFRERLTKLEADRARLLTTYQPGAAPVAIVEEEIATLRQLIDSRGATEVGSATIEINPLRQQLQQSLTQDTVALEGLTAATSVQEQQLAGLQQELRRIDGADATLSELERDRAIAEQNYLSAVKRLKDADVESLLDLSRISNVSVAVPPTSTLEPVYPRKLLLMELSLVVGLVLGVAVAVALEWTSDAVYGAEDVEAVTNLVCLGAFEDRRTHRGQAGAA